MIEFAHLHNHSQYSLLDGATDLGAMMKKAAKDGQKAVALTDHGNMFGVFKFVKEAKKHDIKPIVGCEFYLVADRHKKSFEKSKGEKDERYHQLLLAKNAKGYENLSKLCSIGYLEGFYSKYPRIDKDILVQYTEGLIATSCCLGAEIPRALAQGNRDKADELVRWWLDHFGEDFYIEIQRNIKHTVVDDSDMSQEDINIALLALAQKYNIKVIATNDSHYLDEEDALPHDVLLCVNTGAKLSDQNRFKFTGNQFYFKTQQEMYSMFSDVPFVLENTMEIVDKVDMLNLHRDVLLPEFPIPIEFKSQEEYLRHITMIGARKKYKDMTPVIEERLNFELDVISKSGYAGYFLIVQDFTSTAREKGVSVGPGRGSAAGSAVAYCLGITNVDPIAYDLLFERFLNPERVSMPDIDIDFDDEGREQVINYVIDKYGKNKVAQIVTYGTMAARSALRDVGRVLDIPLNEVDKVAKSFPSHPEASIADILQENGINTGLLEKMDSDDVAKAKEFRSLSEQPTQIGEMIRTAKKLEGSVRNTGIHACGVIITPEDMTGIVPVATAKDSELMISQYDNSVAEDAGLLKMDFLGLRTLTIIKDCIKNIKDTKGIDLDIDTIDLTDEQTYELFQRGETVGIFQYESIGMQKHLRDLKPNKFDDLIAMNALFRPGPIQYIPNFINRKHGREEISYDLPEMEEYLESTYGITVYQEQVMLLSQKLAGFTKGQADQLRKAMGKKNRKLIDELFPKFLEGCLAHNHPEPKVKKIWTDWEAFASYAFNKSHSTCYALLGFQTAFLKTHYPSEFLAAVLSHNKNDIGKLNFFLQEGKRMGIDILGPDINESQLNFAVNKKEQIRFGLSALKGVGEGPVENILSERVSGGDFTSIFDMVQRLNLRSVNKKCIDSMVMGGALDCFTDLHRAQFFTPSGQYETFIEQLLRYGQSYQENKANAQFTLFGDMNDLAINVPKAPETPHWPLLFKLEKEKEVTGIYLTGHPLDDYALEFKEFVTNSINESELVIERQMRIAGIVTDVIHGVNQKGNGYCRFTLQDYDGKREITLSNEGYANFKNLINKGNALFIECINQKFSGRENTFLRVNNVELLESVAEKRIKGVKVLLNLSDLSLGAINWLKDVLDNNVGNQSLKLIIIDDIEHSGNLEMLSKTNSVKMTNELAKILYENKFGVKINP